MVSTSLGDTIEHILEVKFRYIGSFPADFVPNLPKFTFAIINTSQAVILENNV